MGILAAEHELHIAIGSGVEGLRHVSQPAIKNGSGQIEFALRSWLGLREGNGGSDGDLLLLHATVNYFSYFK